jgi:DNA-binding transcriptional MerR regulator
MLASPITARDLDDLTHKYEEIRRLRAHPDLPVADVRAAMALLARRFPGSLRELDRLDPERLEARLQALSRARRSGDAEPWMTAHVAYHRATRGALDAKRWLGERRARVVDDATREAFARDPGLAGPAREWCDALADIAAPPGGRLLPLTLARVAKAMGVSIAEVRELVLP